jgi:hypothetical protein
VFASGFIHEAPAVSVRAALDAVGGVWSEFPAQPASRAAVTSALAPRPGEFKIFIGEEA